MPRQLIPLNFKGKDQFLLIQKRFISNTTEYNWLIISKCFKVLGVENSDSIIARFNTHSSKTDGLNFMIGGQQECKYIKGELYIPLTFSHPLDNITQVIGYYSKPIDLYNYIKTAELLED